MNILNSKLFHSNYMVKQMIIIGMVSVLICYFNIEIKINKNRFE